MSIPRERRRANRQSTGDLQRMQVMSVCQDFGDNILSVSQEVLLASLKVNHGYMIKRPCSSIGNRQLHEVVVFGENRGFVDGKPSFRALQVFVEQLSESINASKNFGDESAKIDKRRRS